MPPAKASTRPSPTSTLHHVRSARRSCGSTPSSIARPTTNGAVTAAACHIRPPAIASSTPGRSRTIRRQRYRHAAWRLAASTSGTAQKYRQAARKGPACAGPFAVGDRLRRRRAALTRASAIPPPSSHRTLLDVVEQGRAGRPDREAFPASVGDGGRQRDPRLVLG